MAFRGLRKDSPQWIERKQLALKMIREGATAAAIKDATAERFGWGLHPSDVNKLRKEDGHHPPQKRGDGRASKQTLPANPHNGQVVVFKRPEELALDAAIDALLLAMRGAGVSKVEALSNGAVSVMRVERYRRP